MADPAQHSVVVFDYNWSGHIPSYHRLVVESALRAGHRVISLSGGSREVKAYINQLLPERDADLFAPDCPELGHRPERVSKLAILRWIPGGYSIWSKIRQNPSLRKRHALNRWRTCHEVLCRVAHRILSPSLLLLPYLDDMLEPDLRAGDLPISLPWAGLYMSASDLRHPVLREQVEHRLHLFSDSRCRGIALLDEGAMGSLRSLVPARLPIVTLPDTADAALPDREASMWAAQLAKHAAGRKIIGLLGHISEAKNLNMFTQIAGAPHNRDLFFLLAGQYEALSVNPAARRWIAKAASGAWENILAIPGRLQSEAEFNLLIKRCNVVFGVYPNFTRSSNMLTKAAIFRRPILVARGYCMAERVKAFGLGLAAGETNVTECEGALRQLAAKGAPEAEYERFDHDFSHEAFAIGVAAFISACGLRSSGP